MIHTPHWIFPDKMTSLRRSFWTCSLLLTIAAAKADAGCPPCYWEDAVGGCSWVGGKGCVAASQPPAATPPPPPATTFAGPPHPSAPPPAGTPPSQPPPPPSIPPPPPRSITKSNLPKPPAEPSNEGQPQPGDPNWVDDFGAGKDDGAVAFGARALGAPNLGDASARDSARASLAEARSALVRGSYGWAIQAATQSLEKYPNNPGALGIRAQAENLSGDYKRAEEDALAAIQLHPNPAAYQNLAYAQLRQGRFQDATASADKAVQANPQGALGWAIRAYAEDAMKNKQAALWSIRRAAELDGAFEAKRQAAEAGESIFDPSEDNASLLARGMGPRAPASERFPWEGALEALALVAAIAITAFILRRRRRSGSWRVALTPLPPVRLLTPRAPTGPEDTWVGKYELGRLIGRGGMGVVYEGMDHSLGRTVAIKKMSDTLGAQGEKWRSAYIQEARTVASLHHPSIVDIYDIVEQGERIYLVFEFVRGKTVHELLASDGRFSLHKAIEILSPICDALAAAHARGLVHRDLKPMNIMVSEDGRPKLMDFGIARTLTTGDDGKPAVNRTQTVLGTPVYMAPECWQGIVRKESDIYSLGVCLYEMLTGSLPFRFPNPMAPPTGAFFERPSAKIRDLPVEIDDFMFAALEPDPNRRIADAKEFLSRLKAAAKYSARTPV